MTISFDSIDLIVFIIANLINLLISVLFVCRRKELVKTEYWLGLIVVFMALPIIIIILMNWFNQREWWTYVLPLPMVLYAIIELLFDYLLKIPLA